MTRQRLHSPDPRDRVLLSRLRVLALQLARDFGLPEPKLGCTAPRTTAVLGRCWHHHAEVALTLRRRGALRPTHSIVRTLAHELAHLRHPNHRREFRELDVAIAQRAERLTGWTPAGDTCLPPIDRPWHPGPMPRPRAARPPKARPAPTPADLAEARRLHRARKLAHWERRLAAAGRMVRKWRRLVASADRSAARRLGLTEGNPPAPMEDAT